MGRKSKAKNRSLKASKVSAHKKYEENISIDRPIVLILSARSFVFAVLYNGFTFSSAYMFSLMNNLIPPSKSLYYKIQPDIICELIKKSVQSVNLHAQNVENGATLCFDGA